jgi:hypothetical protein
VELAGIVNDNHRHIIYGVIEEITVKPPKESLALQLMPTVDVPAAVLEHEVVQATGGLTNERVMGAPGTSVSGPSSTSVLFKPGAYQDVTKFTETDLLKLRRLGTLGERGITGLTGGELNWMERVAQEHKRRMLNRMSKLVWDALTLGTYTYQNIVHNFGIPAGNQFVAASQWSQAGVGTPFEDLINLLETNAFFIKYRPLIKGLAINPITAASILLRALEAKVITNNNITSAGINEVKRFMAPGLPDFIVVDDAWQDQTENQDGSISLANAQYMFPTNVVMPLIDFGSAGVLWPKYGELQITENMNDPSATVDSPAVGVYTFIDEEGLIKRKAPYVELVSGFNGAPNLHRPHDVILITTS